MTQAQTRQYYYALLSRVLMHETDEALLRSILDNDALMDMLPDLLAEKEAILNDPERYIQETLNPDFTDLFLLQLVPYESFYTSENAMMNTGGSNPVNQLFDRYGFQVDLGRGRVIASDHIGVELEFMHLLAGSQAGAEANRDQEALAEIIDTQWLFLKEHLLAWAPLYLLNLKTEAKTGYYQDFADITLDFLFSDFEYLGNARSQ